MNIHKILYEIIAGNSTITTAFGHTAASPRIFRPSEMPIEFDLNGGIALSWWVTRSDLDEDSEGGYGTFSVSFATYAENAEAAWDGNNVLLPIFSALGEAGPVSTDNGMLRAMERDDAGHDGYDDRVNWPFVESQFTVGATDL